MTWLIGVVSSELGYYFIESCLVRLFLFGEHAEYLIDLVVDRVIGFRIVSFPCDRCAKCGSGGISIV